MTSSETWESAQPCHTDNSYTDTSWFDDGWSYDEWNVDQSSVGWHGGWGQTDDTSAGPHFHWEVDLGAMSGPKRFKWVKMNLDTGAAVNIYPLKFGPDAARDGKNSQSASGECILDGGVS